MISDESLWLEEELRIRQLQQLVDHAADCIRFGNLSLAEAIRLADATRCEAERIIPDQMTTYELIYESRLTRLIWQFVGPKGA